METSRLQGADYPRDDHPTAWPEKHYRTLFTQLKYWCGITESPAIEFFFFNHSLQRQKINPQRVLNLNCSSSKSASVPPSFLRYVGRSQFRTKIVDNTRTKTTLFGKRCPCNHILRGEVHGFLAFFLFFLTLLVSTPPRSKCACMKATRCCGTWTPCSVLILRFIALYL